MCGTAALRSSPFIVLVRFQECKGQLLPRRVIQKSISGQKITRMKSSSCQSAECKSATRIICTVPRGLTVVIAQTPLFYEYCSRARSFLHSLVRPDFSKDTNWSGQIVQEIIELQQQDRFAQKLIGTRPDFEPPNLSFHWFIDPTDQNRFGSIILDHMN